MAADRPRALLYLIAVGTSIVALLAGCSATGATEHSTRAPGQGAAFHGPMPSPARALPRCPDRYRGGRAPWVPAQHARVDRHSRLAPREVPSTAFLCRYRPTGGGYPLSGRRSLHAGLEHLTSDLTWQPRLLAHQGEICTLVAAPTTHYLIGLSYGDGSFLWVSASDDYNHCTDTSNGDFRAWDVLGDRSIAAFTSGAWPSQPANPCRADTGRLGQETSMVPAGTTGLAICENEHGRTFDSGFEPIAAALDRLPAHVSSEQCGPSPPRSAPSYQLLFTYPAGPPVAVDVTMGCFPEINNLSLQTDSAAAVLPLIQRLLARR